MTIHTKISPMARSYTDQPRQRQIAQSDGRALANAKMTPMALVRAVDSPDQLFLVPILPACEDLNQQQIKTPKTEGVFIQWLSGNATPGQLFDAIDRANFDPALELAREAREQIEQNIRLHIWDVVVIYNPSYDA